MWVLLPLFYFVNSPPLGYNSLIKWGGWWRRDEPFSAGTTLPPSCWWPDKPGSWCQTRSWQFLRERDGERRWVRGKVRGQSADLLFTAALNESLSWSRHMFRGGSVFQAARLPVQFYIKATLAEASLRRKLPTSSETFHALCKLLNKEELF